MIKLNWYIEKMIVPGVCEISRDLDIDDHFVVKVLDKVVPGIWPTADAAMAGAEAFIEKFVDSVNPVDGNPKP